MPRQCLLGPRPLDSKRAQTLGCAVLLALGSAGTVKLLLPAAAEREQTGLSLEEKLRGVWVKGVSAHPNDVVTIRAVQSSQSDFEVVAVRDPGRPALSISLGGERGFLWSRFVTLQLRIDPHERPLPRQVQLKIEVEPRGESQSSAEGMSLRSVQPAHLDCVLNALDNGAQWREAQDNCDEVNTEYVRTVQLVDPSCPSGHPHRWQQVVSLASMGQYTQFWRTADDTPPVAIYLPHLMLVGGQRRPPYAEERRSVYTFDLSDVHGAIVAATFRVFAHRDQMDNLSHAGEGIIPYWSADATESLIVQEIDQSVDELLNPTPGSENAIFELLGSGQVLAKHQVTKDIADEWLSLPLGEAALPGLQATAGQGQWSAAVRIDSLDYAHPNERFFVDHALVDGTGTRQFAIRPQLLLTIECANSPMTVLPGAPRRASANPHRTPLVLGLLLSVAWGLLSLLRSPLRKSAGPPCGLPWGLRAAGKTLWGGLVFVVAMACSPSAFRPASAPSASRAGAHLSELSKWWSTASEWIDPMVASGQLSSVAVGVVQGDQTDFGWFGETPLTKRSLFEIGSLTKVFTAVVLNRAVADSTLQPLGDETPVVNILGQDAVHFSARDLTLRHLVEHTGGYPNFPNSAQGVDLNDPWRGFASEDLQRWLKTAALRVPPGTKRAYSTAAVAVLGHALERHLETPFAHLLEQWVAAPLNLRDTRLVTEWRSQSPGGERTVLGYTADGVPAANWHMHALAPGGGLVSSVEDLQKFLQANLNPNPNTSTGKALLRAQGLTDGGRRQGWLAMDDGSLWHNGQTGGFHSYLAFHATAQVGLVVLANTSALVVDTLALSLWNRLRGRQATGFAPRPTVTLPVSTLRQYVGQYRVVGNRTSNIRIEGDALWAELTGYREQKLYAAARDEFFLRGTHSEIRFHRNVQGNVTGGVLVHGPASLPFKKVP